MAWERAYRSVWRLAGLPNLPRRRRASICPGRIRRQGAAAVVGYAGTGWTTLVSHLHDKGV